MGNYRSSSANACIEFRPPTDLASAPFDNMDRLSPAPSDESQTTAVPRPRPVHDLISRDERSNLDGFIQSHSSKVLQALKKPTDLPSDITVAYVRKAFDEANKDQVLMLLDYGIDIFSMFCGDCSKGQEKWIIDFYGMAARKLRRDTIEEHKTLILKEYRRQKWKISLVGGSIAQFNRRRHFIAFLERFVMNPKNEDLREKAKRLMSIVIVQTRIASYM
jgi:hypothetical protein